MDAIHRLIGDVAAVVTVVATLWVFVLLVTGRAGGRRFVQAQALVVSVFVVGAVSGLLLLLAGHRPVEGLHFLYAALAIVVIPLARSFTGKGSANVGRARMSTILLVVAFVALLGITYRLFATG